MNQSNTMTQVITAIAEKHQFDLSAPFGHLSLAPVYNQPLVIEKHGKDTIAVMHITSDGLSLDPMFRFHMRAVGRWLPISEHMALYNRTRMLAYPLKDRGEWNVNARAQCDAAAFCNDWARNIRSQKWIKQEATPTRFTMTASSAWLISPDDTITEVKPNQVDEGFTLQQLYNLLDCNTVEVTYLDDPDYIMIGDEDGKWGAYEVNGIATRLGRLDERRDEFAGKAILCPNSWFK